MKIFLFFYCFIVCFSYNITAQSVKFSLREGKKNAFFYVDNQDKPTIIYYRESTDKEKIKMEFLGDYGNFQGDYDVIGEVKVKHPRTQKIFIIRPQHFNLLVTYPNGMSDNFLWEYSFEAGKERLYTIMSPVGIGAVYYMSSPQSAPEYGIVENMEKVLEDNVPYQVSMPKYGRAKFVYDTEKKIIIVENQKGKKTTFVQKD